ncbi:hypothetical protein [Oceanobacillus neutriphilus]|uniref:Phage protein n=1 Tax=Oceanobacillus neutriphilus TaxID=531815 RepID=A0ABQ2P3E4_9BACI|nr:hypothetical protein [Oceanobacillus neutriphilus]GGP17288.1 hypothetical protein GCM10011346_52560 [Oceanobacillus neutriphilus]
MTTKEDRLKAVNTIIQEIANRGRGFFREECKKESFFFFTGTERKRLWFWDKRAGKVNPYQLYNQCSEGGTLWALIKDFKEFILTGKYTNGNNGYGGLYCPHWAYPEEDMQAIREKAKQVGYLKGE